MIKGYIIGRRETVQKLRSKKVHATKSVVDTITWLTLKLQRRVKTQKLSGQVLHVRTGTLRRSINYIVHTSGTKTVGVVGTNVKYARVHEFGWSGNRLIKKVFGRQLKFPVWQTVAYPKRSFLGSAFDEMRPEILKKLNLAMRELAKGGL